MRQRDVYMLVLACLGILFVVQDQSNRGTFSFEPAWRHLASSAALAVAQTEFGTAHLPSPLVVDLNGDGTLEIIAVTQDMKLQVVSPTPPVSALRNGGFTNAHLLAEVSIESITRAASFVFQMTSFSDAPYEPWSLTDNPKSVQDTLRAGGQVAIEGEARGGQVQREEDLRKRTAEITASAARRPIHLSAAYLDPATLAIPILGDGDGNGGGGGGGPRPLRKMVVFVVTAAGYLAALDHNLRVSWIVDLHQHTNRHHSKIKEVAVFASPMRMYDGDRGMVIVGLRIQEGDVTSGEALESVGGGERFSFRDSDVLLREMREEFEESVRQQSYKDAASDDSSSSASSSSSSHHRDTSGLKKMPAPRHFDYYAFEGTNGMLRWKHESDDYLPSDVKDWIEGGSDDSADEKDAKLPGMSQDGFNRIRFVKSGSRRASNSTSKNNLRTNGNGGAKEEELEQTMIIETAVKLRTGIQIDASGGVGKSGWDKKRNDTRSLRSVGRGHTAAEEDDDDDDEEDDESVAGGKLHSRHVTLQHAGSRHFGEMTAAQCLRVHHEALTGWRTMPHLWTRPEDTLIQPAVARGGAVIGGAAVSRDGQANADFVASIRSRMGQGAYPQAAKHFKQPNPFASSSSSSSSSLPSLNLDPAGADVLISHLEYGIEMIHLFSGRPICEIPLLPRQLHADLDGDGVMDHVSLTAATSDLGLGSNAGGLQGSSKSVPKLKRMNAIKIVTDGKGGGLDGSEILGGADSSLTAAAAVTVSARKGRCLLTMKKGIPERNRPTWQVEVCRPHLFANGGDFIRLHAAGGGGGGGGAADILATLTAHQEDSHRGLGGDHGGSMGNSDGSSDDDDGYDDDDQEIEILAPILLPLPAIAVIPQRLGSKPAASSTQAARKAPESLFKSRSLNQNPTSAGKLRAAALQAALRDEELKGLESEKGEGKGRNSGGSLKDKKVSTVDILGSNRRARAISAAALASLVSRTKHVRSPHGLIAVLSSAGDLTAVSSGGELLWRVSLPTSWGVSSAARGSGSTLSVLGHTVPTFTVMPLRRPARRLTLSRRSVAIHAAAAAAAAAGGKGGREGGRGKGRGNDSSSDRNYMSSYSFAADDGDFDDSAFVSRQTAMRSVYASDPFIFNNAGEKKGNVRSKNTHQGLVAKGGWSNPTAILAAGTRAAAVVSEHGRVLDLIKFPHPPIAPLIVDDFDGDGLNDLILVTEYGIFGFVQQKRWAASSGGRGGVPIMIAVLIVAIGGTFMAHRQQRRAVVAMVVAAERRERQALQIVEEDSREFEEEGKEEYGWGIEGNRGGKGGRFRVRSTDVE